MHQQQAIAQLQALLPSVEVLPCDTVPNGTIYMHGWKRVCFDRYGFSDVDYGGAVLDQGTAEQAVSYLRDQEG